MNSVSPQYGYFRRARFVMSAPNLTDLPTDRGVEIAVAGRSNAGKSSVLNALCDQRALARTSRTPGRTQHIVVFDLDADRRLLDLPGFGYAQVGRAVREQWAQTLPDLLQFRRALAGLVIVADARAPLKAEEQSLLSWCSGAALPVRLALNKCDKLTRQEGVQALRGVQQILITLGLKATDAMLISAESKQGIDELRGWLHAGFTAGA